MQLAGALRTLICSADTQAAAAAAGAIPAAVAALNAAARLRAPVAAEAVGGLLRNLAAKHPANRAAIGAAGGLKSLTVALTGLTEDRSPLQAAPCAPLALAAEQLCGALWNAVTDSPANAAAATLLGAADALRSVHVAWAGVPAVASAATSALAALGAPTSLDMPAPAPSASARPSLELKGVAQSGQAVAGGGRGKRSPAQAAATGSVAEALPPMAGEHSPRLSDGTAGGSAGSRPPVRGGAAGAVVAPKKALRRAATGLGAAAQQPGPISAGGGAAVTVSKPTASGSLRSARGSSASGDKR